MQVDDDRERPVERSEKALTVDGKQDETMQRLIVVRQEEVALTIYADGVRASTLLNAVIQIANTIELNT